MRREHIKENWWEMPGKPVPELKWPGTKNGESHRVWMPAQVMELIVELTEDDPSSGFVFATSNGNAIDTMAEAMRSICSELKAESGYTS